jgi:WS/DGAT/MGAT family acyltransferase
MHIGWVALFSPAADGRPPDFLALREHIGRRLGGARRYRQKLAGVPLGLRAPEWVDDPAFSVDRHVYWAPGPLQDLVDEVMSVPLRRDRPLWEMWVCDAAAHERLAIVGKFHHCMVDGLAALELGSLLLDPTPEPSLRPSARWRAAPEPGPRQLLLHGLRDLAGDQLSLLGRSLQGCASPLCSARTTVAGAGRAARAVGHAALRAPVSALNGPLSPLRRLAWAERPFGDLRRVKQAAGVSVNDVLLTAVSGGLRTYLLRHGEEPMPLKAMVPVNMRRSDEVLGNRLSFVFAPLPCDESDPMTRLRRVQGWMARCKSDGQPEGADLALKAAEYAPGLVQQAISKLFASPRTFNLVVSNIPGPTQPCYMLGCRLESIYPVIPLADRHAVSVGMTTVGERACFGVYADRETLPDVELLAHYIDDAIAELLSCTQGMTDRTPRRRNRRQRNRPRDMYYRPS